jgi:hypothetical protein
VEVDGDHQPKRFSTWAPKVIASIGKLAETVMDRSVVIPMKRKLPGERVEKLRNPAKSEAFAVLRGRLARWAADNGPKLAGADDPAVPPGLHDRAADNWTTLIAIAEVLGGDWPRKAREAATALSGETQTDADSTRALLLEDIQTLFKERAVDRLKSADITGYLGNLEHRPWPEWKAGKPMTQAQLARQLAHFGIVPIEMRIDGRKERGYIKTLFDDAFARYVPDRSGTPGQTASIQAFSAVSDPVRLSACTGSKNAQNPDETSISPTVPAQKPESGGGGGEEEQVRWEV